MQTEPIQQGNRPTAQIPSFLRSTESIMGGVNPSAAAHIESTLVLQSFSHPFLQSSCLPVLQSSCLPVLQSFCLPFLQSSCPSVLQSFSPPFLLSFSPPGQSGPLAPVLQQISPARSAARCWGWSFSSVGLQAWWGTPDRRPAEPASREAPFLLSADYY